MQLLRDVLSVRRSLERLCLALFMTSFFGWAGCKSSAPQPTSADHLPEPDPTSNQPTGVPGTGGSGPVDDGDMSEAQKRTLKLIRAAKSQDPRKWDPEVRALLEKIRPGDGTFKGLSKGQLIRAIGVPNKHCGILANT